MVELVFEDPPEYMPTVTPASFDIKKNEFREEIVRELRNHPNRWAIVSRHDSRNRAAQVSYVLRARHPENYEFRAARRNDGEGVVYGRFLGADVNM